MQEDEDKLGALRKSYQMKRYTRDLIAAWQAEKALCTDFSAPNIAALNTSQSCKAKRTTCMYGSSASASTDHMLCRSTGYRKQLESIIPFVNLADFNQKVADLRDAVVVLERDGSSIECNVNLCAINCRI